MTALAQQLVLSFAADPVEVLLARAESRAYLWFEHEISDLAEAVDPLWQAAEDTGVLDIIGADAVQALLAEAFRPYRGDVYALAT